MVHFVVILAFLLSCLCKKNKYFLVIPFLILLMFESLRYDYGNDYFSYYNIFNLIHDGNEIFQKEILFYIINKYMFNFQVMIALIEGLFLYLIYKLIYKNLEKEYYFIAIFLFLFNPYIFLISLSAIRQTLAICIFIFAIQFAYKRKIIPFICTILLASLVHKSAIFLLPVYFIANDKTISKKTVWIIIIILIFLLLMPNVFNNLLYSVLSLVNDNNYLNYALNSKESSVASLMFAIIIFIYLILNISKLKGKNLVYTKLYLISAIIGILAFRLNMLSRFQQYFDVFLIIAIPAILYTNKIIKKDETKFLNFTNRIVLPTAILVIFLLKYYSFFSDPLWSNFLEYNII